jgi:ABC-type transport system substrate-binding protein
MLNTFASTDVVKGVYDAFGNLEGPINIDPEAPVDEIIAALTRLVVRKLGLAEGMDLDQVPQLRITEREAHAAERQPGRPIIYAVTLHATRAEDEVLATSAYTMPVILPDWEDAEAMGLEMARERYPEAEGYIDHGATVGAIQRLEIENWCEALGSRKFAVNFANGDPIPPVARPEPAIWAMAECREPTEPHPIIGDARVRQAIAYAIDRTALINAVYPWLSAEQRQALELDTLLPAGHQMLHADHMRTGEHDPALAARLLDEAGWLLRPGHRVRTNDRGEALSLSITTLGHSYTQRWVDALIRQLAAVGIQIIPTFAPAQWLFGGTTGLQRRDFELVAYPAPVEPGTPDQYSASYIPSRVNHWHGRNITGWDNPTASRLSGAATTASNPDGLARAYSGLQSELAWDLPSLPLFAHAAAVAARLHLTGLQPDISEPITHNVTEWRRSDGGEQVTIVLCREPDTLWGPGTRVAEQRTLGYLLGNNGGQGWAYTSCGSSYLPGALSHIPAWERGDITRTAVEVAEGCEVWGAMGLPVILEAGVEVRDGTGSAVPYQPGRQLVMEQISVTFTYQEGLCWSDGEPLTRDDFLLALRIDSHPLSGTISRMMVSSIASVTFHSDHRYTVTFLPGATWPELQLACLNAYPSHLKLRDGRTLGAVSGYEWGAIAAVHESPLSLGPYVLESWEHGLEMVFTANEHYQGPRPAIKRIVVRFFSDPLFATQALLAGEVDLLDTDSLGGSEELQEIIEAGERGEIQVFPTLGRSIERLDFNLSY